MSKLNTAFSLDTKSNRAYVLADQVEVYVPRSYEKYGLLTLLDTVTTLGIFGLKVNGSISGGLCLPAIINTKPRVTYPTTIDENEYLVMTYEKGDEFFTSLSFIKNERLAFVVYNEFMQLGNMPSFLNYNQRTALFDLVAQTCGVKFGVDHAVIEMMFAHLHRNPKDLTQEYRLTNMTDLPTFVKLRSISYGPTSPAAKFMGSYMDVGLNSAMVNAADGEASTLETILCS